jgi:hypothetical protein
MPGRDRPLRGFRLTVLPERGEGCDLPLEATNGEAVKPPVPVATAPIRRASRAGAIADAVAAMSVEQAYYWYARSIGPEAARIRRALRLFLTGG